MVKDVVPCDITRDQFIQEGYEGLYDIVTSSVCIEDATCSKTEAVCEQAVCKLAKLTKPGGILLLHSTESSSDSGPI